MFANQKQLQIWSVVFFSAFTLVAGWGIFACSPLWITLTHESTEHVALALAVNQRVTESEDIGASLAALPAFVMLAALPALAPEISAAPVRLISREAAQVILALHTEIVRWNSWKIAPPAGYVSFSAAGSQRPV
jgi:hypothetical protein